MTESGASKLYFRENGRVCIVEIRAIDNYNQDGTRHAMAKSARLRHCVNIVLEGK